MAGILDLLAEIEKCEQADATLATIALCYMCIDAMSYAAMPADQAKNGGNDFIEWVDRYLKADPQQPYQYKGKDVWGARCSYLHTFSSSSDFHQKYPDTIKFLYQVGNSHGFDPINAAGYALIDVPTFAHDISKSVLAFLTEASADPEKGPIVTKRLDSFFACYPVS
jgi:hypothetical protein